MSYSVYRRNSVVLELTIKDEDGTAVDITGCDLLFLVSSQIEKSTDNGIKVIDSATGKIEVHLTADDTNIPARNYTCELLVTDIEGNRWSGAITGFLVKNNISFQVD
jgi:hypothetical protein